jgi:leucine proline-enriched proteoglycan (leprecan)
MAAAAAVVPFLCLVLFCGRSMSALFDQPYAEGVAAYKDGDWTKTVSFMEDALKQYSSYSDTLETCVLKCGRKERSKPVDYPEDPDILWYHALIDLAACYKNCFDESGVDIADGVNYGLYNEFITGDPYNYLQMAHHKNGNNKAGSEIAAKFAGMNPLNEMAQRNIKYYDSVSEGKVQPSFPEYQELYETALQAYSKEDYGQMVEIMEKSLQSFLVELEICRQRCFGPLLRSGPLEYSTGMARHLLSLLECRGGCVEKLGKFPRDTDDYFLLSFFRYLHVGYFKVRNYKTALMSFLTQKRLSGASSEEIRSNELVYRNVTSLTQSDWKEREDVAEVIEDIETDHFMIYTLHQLMGKDPFVDVTESEDEEDEMDQMLLDQDYINHPVGLKEELKPVILERNDSFERIVSDGFLDKKQCRELMQLARIGTEGDGYNRPSPHTKHEKFEGLTILAAAKAAKSGNTTTKLARLYFDACESVRSYLEQHFKLTSHLFFSYSHLVCRTAKDGVQNRDDLSHPVHSDNCVLDARTGECNKIPPAYTWRDYRYCM